jgi:hypothetical protein
VKKYENLFLLPSPTLALSLTNPGSKFRLVIF